MQLLLIYLGFIVIPVILISIFHFIFTELALSIVFATFIISLFSMLFSVWLLAWILRHDTGSQAMQDVALPIKEGSEGFFKTQYGTIFRLAFIFSVILFVMYFYSYKVEQNVKEPIFGRLSAAFIIALSFVIGAIFSALSGYAGMWVSVRANVRVTSAARRCYNEALQICFRGGAFGAIVNVALAIFGISSLYLFLRFYIKIFGGNDHESKAAAID